MGTTLMKGTIRNGRIETDIPVYFPDGTQLLISIDNNNGIDVEAAWNESPESVAAWLQWIDSLQPQKKTPDEQADSDSWIRIMDEHEAKKGDNDIEDLFA